MKGIFKKGSGSYTNNTASYLVVYGYDGAYVVNDPSGNETSGMSSSIPYAVVPPNYTLTGGTRFWGFLVEMQEL